MNTSPKNITIIIVLVVLAIAGAVYFNTYRSLSPKPQIPAEDETVFCTADAMQCPDGSYVGRTGPNCEFVCP